MGVKVCTSSNVPKKTFAGEAKVAVSHLCVLRMEFAAMEHSLLLLNGLQPSCESEEQAVVLRSRGYAKH